MNKYRKEAQCPFCMSNEHYKYDPFKCGPEYAWRADKGPGITVALKHKPTCPRYLKCMDCGGDAITGAMGICATCCEKEEPGTIEVGHAHTAPPGETCGPECKACADNFVPDFHRCNACGNVGADDFGYAANPKGLPAIEAPILAIDLVSNFDEQGKRKDGPNVVPIAEIFGCARTGEEGAVYCRKCRSFDIGHVSAEERNKLMLDACGESLVRGDGGPINDKDEVLFLEGVARKALGGFDALGGYDFSATEVLRLYKNYKKLIEGGS